MKKLSLPLIALSLITLSSAALAEPVPGAIARDSVVQAIARRAMKDNQLQCAAPVYTSNAQSTKVDVVSWTLRYKCSSRSNPESKSLIEIQGKLEDSSISLSNYKYLPVRSLSAGPGADLILGYEDAKAIFEILERNQIGQDFSGSQGSFYHGTNFDCGHLRASDEDYTGTDKDYSCAFTPVSASN